MCMRHTSRGDAAGVQQRLAGRFGGKFEAEGGCAGPGGKVDAPELSSGPGWEEHIVKGYILKRDAEPFNSR